MTSYDKPTYDELLERVEKLEKHTLALKDLPIAALQKRLEQDWQPDAGLLLGDDSVTAEMLASTLTWTTLPTLQSGVTAYSPVSYTKDALGHVHCQGELLLPALAAGTLLWTFPGGHRPAGDRFGCPVWVHEAGGHSVYVNTSGTVLLGYATGANYHMNIGSIRFPTT